MSVQSYSYRHNNHPGMLLTGSDNEPYLFQIEDGTAYPLSLDDEITLDTPEAAFLAEVDALMSAWRELCGTAPELSNSEAAQQTLLNGLEIMRQAVDTGGGTDPAPALALVHAA